MRIDRDGIRAKLLTRVIALLQQSKRFTDNLARSLVKTAIDFFVHKPFELRRQ